MIHRKDTPFLMRSATLFSLPTNTGDVGDSDEDLFLNLYEEKAERKAAGIPEAAAPSSYNMAEGAGVPRPSLEPDEIVALLMTALQNVDVPNVDGGLASMWEFAGDTTKFIFQNNRTGE